VQDRATQECDPSGSAGLAKWQGGEQIAAFVVSFTLENKSDKLAGVWGRQPLTP